MLSFVYNIQKSDDRCGIKTTLKRQSVNGCHKNVLIRGETRARVSILIGMIHIAQESRGKGLTNSVRKEDMFLRTPFSVTFVLKKRFSREN